MTRRLLVALTCLLLAARVEGANEVAWDFPRDYTPPPEKFYLMVIGPQSLDTLWVAPSVPGACGAAPASTPDTFCAVLPDCPTQGTYEVLVKAVVGGEEGPWSEPLLCRYDRQTPCTCLTVTATPTSATEDPTVPAHTPPGPPDSSTPNPPALEPHPGAPTATVVPPRSSTPTFTPAQAPTAPVAPTIPALQQVTIPLMQALPQLAPA